jgi:hypothetical protein
VRSGCACGAQAVAEAVQWQRRNCRAQRAERELHDTHPVPMDDMAAAAASPAPRQAEGRAGEWGVPAPNAGPASKPLALRSPRRMLALAHGPARLLLRRALPRPQLRRRAAMASVASGAATDAQPPPPKAKKGAFSAEALYVYPAGMTPPVRALLYMRLAAHRLMLTLLRSLLAAAQTLVDIGANLGTLTPRPRGNCVFCASAAR